jgi:hypothetical protein
MKFLLRVLQCGALCVAVAGCGSSGPSGETIAQAIQQGLPDNWHFKLERSEALPIKNMPEQFALINYRGTATLKEALYSTVNKNEVFKKHNVAYPASSNDVHYYVDDEDNSQLKKKIQQQLNTADRVELNNIPVFIAKTAEAGQSVQVEGRCQAEKRLDEWRIRCSRISMEMKGALAGSPMKDLASRHSGKMLGNESPEADAYFTDLKAQRQKRKQKLLTDLKLRQKARDRARVRYMPFVSKGQTYKGILTLVERGAVGRIEETMNIHIQFKVDGKKVKARLTHTNIPTMPRRKNSRRGKEEEYANLEGYWLPLTKEYLNGNKVHPLVMTNVSSRYLWFIPKKSGVIYRNARKSAPDLFRHTNSILLRFEFHGEKLIGSFESKDAKYRLSATLVDSSG